MIMIASWNNNNCMEIIIFSIERTSSSFFLSASVFVGVAMAQFKIQDSWAQTDVLDRLGDCMVGFQMTWGNLRL